METKVKPYNASSEIDFIDGLGSFGINEKGSDNRKTKHELLKGYLIAAGKRVNWGSIDKETVLHHVRGELLAMAKAA